MKRLFTIGLTLLLTGCASAVAAMSGEPTPYRTEFELLGSWHGTRAEAVSPDVYLIRTSVNPSTDPDIMSEYNMLKAAQLAADGKFPFIVVLTPQRDFVRQFVRVDRIMGTRSVEGQNYFSELHVRLAGEPDPDLPSFSAADVLAEFGPKHIND
ncbi:MAG: hypothetical protein AAFO88_03880 [Pseudomonadota bacterium]